MIEPTPVMPRTPLVRAIGRWSLAALTLNCIVGAGLLGLPGKVFALAGAATGWVVATAAVLALAAALCLAELGSRMDGSGGPAQYCRAAFGPIAGFAIGWLAWAATVLAAASLLNLFAALVASVHRAPIILATGAALTLVAASGAGRSATASNVLAVLKLSLFAGIALVGLIAPAEPAVLPDGPAHPAPALVLLFFAFVGFERPSAVAGEVADARGAVPFALLIGIIAASLLNGGVIAACLRGVPRLAASNQPVGDLAARIFGAEISAAFQAAAAVIVLGTLTSQWITAPRVLLALAEDRQLPPAFARLARGRGTPDVAIVTTGVLAVALALGGDFVTSIAASSASRLLIFIACAAALVRLRRVPNRSAARFRLPAGEVIAICVIIGCTGLLIAASAELARLAILLVIGGLLWLISNWNKVVR
ncbi:MAG: APC family permease [Janthinobacterium lividum]